MSERASVAAGLGAVLLLVFVLAVAGMRLVNENPLPAKRDECVHLKNAVLFQRTLEKSPAAFIALLGGRMEGGYGQVVYPPLQPAVTAVLKSILPYASDYRASAATNYLWWFVLLASLFLAGRRIAGWTGGVFSAFLFALYPIVFREMPAYSPYSVAAAPVALAFWLLLRTESFTRAGASALFGIGVAVCLLAYYTTPVFLIGPVLACLVLGIARNPGERGRVALRAALAISIALALALPYYTTANFRAYFGKMMEFFIGSVRGRPGDFGLGSPDEYGLAAHVFYYAIVLWTEQVGPLLLAAAAVGAGLLVRKTSGHRAALLVGAVLPIVLLSFVGSKLVERTVPALPFFALVTGAGLARLPRAWLRWAVFAALAVAACVPLFRDHQREYDYRRTETEAGRTYLREVELFREIAKTRDGPITIACGANHPFYEYLCSLSGLGCTVWSAVHHQQFYEHFADVEIAAFVSLPGVNYKNDEWFTADYLREKAALRAYLHPDLSAAAAESVAASRDRFVRLACHEILDRNYCTWARRDWWEGAPSRSAGP